MINVNINYQSLSDKELNQLKYEIDNERKRRLSQSYVKNESSFLT